ncbi:FliH/SctL family protein [Asaia bogorensis]|uniref:Flagellar assembly protein FliH/Type III secretion system HrpE domain-containing protein n=2 Tax=Asaia TaxID=91914 RepID=A0A060QL78_9PROT|nr:hypothetical protein [Asaia bogorensis]CDG40536.1 hypothetical protein ASAP_2491 [Asaia bogorensis]
MRDFVPFSLKSRREDQASNVDTATLPLARHLVDFDAKPMPPAPPPATDQSDSAPADGQAKPLVSFAQDEIDALQRDAYDAGFAAGAASEQARAEANLSSTLADMIRQNEDVCARHFGLAQKAGEIFAEALVDIVSALTRLPPEQLNGIHRDLLQDAIDLILGSETVVEVTCTADDEVRLRSAITQPDKIRFEPCAVPGDSRIRISTETNTIVLDPEEWRRKAIEKVLTSLNSLQRSPTASPETTNGP